MMETVLFVIAMAMALIIAGMVMVLITLALMSSDWFVKKYAKAATKMTKFVMGAMFDSEEEDEEA